ncbi:Fe2+-dependent dioxygenase [Sphingosinicella rhizophila]|uniref:Fe2+-dependent dioxygenase n=1 Tax=Sphingosinicella rhizophila TaxID=3050082 RepID=A0ABU3Q5N7_9SPHN|nr:Fe2+-dependent dioxygenase [Sphingosinicella sp. GR2756]MDT9598384.1 Fe2+-dependent dioxygenase [Sphingosinicella sp. GR2756]
MLLAIPSLLSSGQVAEVRSLIDEGRWEDGRETAGKQSALAKRNRQIAADCAQGEKARAIVLQALQEDGLFLSAALPRAIFPPLFNRYDGGVRHAFGNHVDNAIRYLPDGSGSIRTDLSATLFLSAPEDYDGGELVIEDSYGAHEVKLAAGDLILYPSTSLHRVEPVTRGSRICSFFWIESRVRDDAQRTILLDMDAAIRSLAQQLGDDRAEVVSLTGCYHNLVRQWASS